LREREREVLGLLAAGLTKLDLRHTVQAAIFAHQDGLTA